METLKNDLKAAMAELVENGGTLSDILSVLQEVVTEQTAEGGATEGVAINRHLSRAKELIDQELDC